MIRYLLILLLFIIISSCRKNTVIESSGLYLNTCTLKTFNTETINICFDSINDSRCPSDVTCVWSGVAIAKFTFTKANISYPLTLTTLPVFHPYSSDTIVAGYKFHLVNILPYPKFSSPASPSGIHALLDISKL